MTVPPVHTDGNALAGPLSELFAVDLTSAMTTCSDCGLQSRVAQLHVYSGGPGTIARCPGCGHAVVRFASTPTWTVLDLRGTIALAVPRRDATLPPGYGEQQLVL